MSEQTLQPSELPTNSDERQTDDSNPSGYAQLADLPSTAEQTHVELHVLSSHEAVSLMSRRGSSSASSTLPVSHDKSSKASQHGIGSWKWEIGAVLICLISTSTTAAVLCWQDGAALASWNFLASLNTLISILGTVARAPLAFAITGCVGQQKWNHLHRQGDQLIGFQCFDDASRGPWGSLKLIYWVKMKQWVILGAYATILLLVFDPFLQATVSYSGNLEDDNSRGGLRIAALQDLDAGIWQPTNTETNNSFQFSLNRTDVTPHRLRFYEVDYYNLGIIKPDRRVENAFYAGFANTSSYAHPTLNFDCGTGNCTWPEYSSLAVCSRCSDVGDHVAFETTQDGFNERQGTYRWPYLSITNRLGVGGSGSEGFAMNAIANQSLSVSFQDYDTMLLSVLTARAPISYLKSQIPWENVSISANECALYLCINSYRSSVTDGKLSESSTQSPFSRDQASFLPRVESSAGPLHEYWPMSKIAELRVCNEAACEIPEWYRSINTSLYPFTSPILHNFTTIFSDLQLQTPGDSQSTQSNKFKISQTTLTSTIDFLLKSFTGGLDFRWDGSRVDDFDANNKVADELRESTNLTATFEYIAGNLTTQIRNFGNAPVNGTMQRWTLHTKIRWPFGIPPFIAVLLGCVYVCLVIVETSMLGLPVWKERLLPVMAWGLDENAQQLARDAIEGQTMRDLSKRSKMELKRGLDGLQLKATFDDGAP